MRRFGGGNTASRKKRICKSREKNSQNLKHGDHAEKVWGIKGGERGQSLKRL